MCGTLSHSLLNLISLVLNSEWNGVHVAQATARGSQVLGLNRLHGEPHLESRKKGGKEEWNGKRKGGRKEKKEKGRAHELRAQEET